MAAATTRKIENPTTVRFCVFVACAEDKHINKVIIYTEMDIFYNILMSISSSGGNKRQKHAFSVGNALREFH